MTMAFRIAASATSCKASCTMPECQMSMMLGKDALQLVRLIHRLGHERLAVLPLVHSVDHPGGHADDRPGGLDGDLPDGILLVQGVLYPLAICSRFCMEEIGRDIRKLSPGPGACAPPVCAPAPSCRCRAARISSPCTWDRPASQMRLGLLYGVGHSDHAHGPGGCRQDLAVLLVHHRVVQCGLRPRLSPSRPP